MKGFVEKPVYISDLTFWYLYRNLGYRAGTSIIIKMIPKLGIMSQHQYYIDIMSYLVLINLTITHLILQKQNDNKRKILMTMIQSLNAKWLYDGPRGNPAAQLTDLYPADKLLYMLAYSTSLTPLEGHVMVTISIMNCQE